MAHFRPPPHGRIVSALPPHFQPPLLYNAVMESNAECNIRVGPAGWSYDDWKGIVYPAGMPRTRHPLGLLANWFDTVEINATFYRPAQPIHAVAWLRHIAGNPRFMFTAKLWERFTHQRTEWPGTAEINAFCAGLQPLAEAGKLGAVLVQFPWSFRRTPENRIWLARIADAFSKYALSVELRHASWDCPEVYEGFAQRGIAVCNIDQPLFEDSIAPAEHITAPIAYVRFHGRNYQAWFREDAGRNARYDYLYNEDELQPWIDRVNRMKKRVNDLFIITNNHYRGQAIVNAIEIQAALGKERYALPQHLIDEYPRLKRLLHTVPEPLAGPQNNPEKV